jgi:hypothetical protein
MKTQMSTPPIAATETHPTATAERGGLELLGRGLFAAIFVLAGAKNVSPRARLAQAHLTMFLKNLSMLGGALLLAQFGAGPWSLDARRARRGAGRTIETIRMDDKPAEPRGTTIMMIATRGVQRRAARRCFRALRSPQITLYFHPPGVTRPNRGGPTLWGMKSFATLARHLVRSALIVCAISLAAPGAAQDPEVDVPETPPPGEERGTLFVPGVWLGVMTPLRDRVSLNVYGFYYGEVDVPVAQVDLVFRPWKFLSITPSYLYYEVPPSGLSKAATRPASFSDTFEEDQFRIDATLYFSLRQLEIHGRTMYVRRFRPTDELDRYRYRIGIAHPFSVKGDTWKPFSTFERFYESGTGGWN